MWSLIERFMMPLLRTKEVEETRITSGAVSVVAVILVGDFMSCRRFISDAKLFSALNSGRLSFKGSTEGPSVQN